MGMILHVSVSEKFHPNVVTEKTPPHKTHFTGAAQFLNTDF